MPNEELVRIVAKHAGNCCMCGGPIYVNQIIYQGTTKGISVAAHGQCAAGNPDKALDIFDHDSNCGAQEVSIGTK